MPDSDIIGLPVICSRLFRFSSFYVKKKRHQKRERPGGQKIGSLAWTRSAAVYMRGWLKTVVLCYARASCALKRNNSSKWLFDMRQIMRQIRNVVVFHAQHSGRHIGVAPGAVAVSKLFDRLH